jgi:D-beta-D-heptose 7-phosphate kinase/D-beta-D-heptose 1-phosphate adenosyltransferase
MIPMNVVFEKISNGKILVIGDLLLDRYLSGTTSRISPEAPVPIVRVENTIERIGGAGNVAANAATLGAVVCLVGQIGDDVDGAKIEQIAGSLGIQCGLVKNFGYSTIVKTRVVSQGQQMLRIDFEQPCDSEESKKVRNEFAKYLEKFDVVVISDYGKGSVGQVEVLIKDAKALGRFVIVDPKGVEFSKYRGVDLLTPNLREFEAAVGNCGSDEVLIAKARKMLKKLSIRSILITKGALGMVLVEDENHLTVAAEAKEVFDVTGAGDTVCGVMAAFIAAGSSARDAVAYANKAAGVVVGRFGASALTLDEVKRFDIGSEEKTGILELGELKSVLDDSRAKGHTIVMTNGCFDVLHKGHVSHLSEARKLGDRLVVAVNSDFSVTRLKGVNRPINNLEARMEVLAALKSVDWVVAFSEDTPESLIGEILPHVLVKGGDYVASEIAGSDHVIAAGGKVEVLPFHEGFSSTGILNKLGEDL